MLGGISGVKKINLKDKIEELETNSKINLYWDMNGFKKVYRHRNKK